MGNIVWLASYPKSGNTWLRAFLANLIANRPPYWMFQHAGLPPPSNDKYIVSTYLMF